MFRHPDNGNTAQCRNLPVVYGPIVYVRDRNEYLQRSMSEVEFVIRCIFAKAIGDEFQNTYQHQREYRFAILAARRLDYPTLDLTTSAEMRETMKLPPPRQTTRRRPSVQVGGCLPSPRILRCLSGWPSSQASGTSRRNRLVVATPRQFPNQRHASPECNHDTPSRAKPSK